MSIDNCENCDAFIDTDYDDEFYMESSNGIHGLCQHCRELIDRCDGCGNELAEFETTKTCRNCMR